MTIAVDSGRKATKQTSLKGCDKTVESLFAADEFMNHCSDKIKKDSKDQEPIQSSITPVPGYQKGK